MKKENIRTILIALVTCAAGVFIGALFFTAPTETEQGHVHGADEVYTCSMHPQIRQNEQGKCPICGMDLIPASTQSTADEYIIEMSETAQKLANVQTATVGSGTSGKSLRLNGKVAADERRIVTQSTHIPGRVEKLLINFTGEYVKKGQIIAYIHSPTVITAQEELLEAHRIKEDQPLLYEAAIEKMRHWNITERQINRILANGKVQEEVPIFAEVSGFVISKMIKLGEYVEIGTAIYEIADLSEVWLLFEVYESDLGLIREGDEIRYSVQALPGEEFVGKIDFIDPVIDPATRVSYARIEQNNGDNRLKPEMFATGTVSTTGSSDSELVIPKSAVLWTGKRSIIYLVAGAGEYRMQEVTLGRAMGDSYEVASGLNPGDEIVINGAFSIDASAQLSGKPSMMTVENIKPQSTSINTQGRKALEAMYEAYLEWKDELVDDDFENARAAATQMKKAWEALDRQTLGTLTGWDTFDQELGTGLEHVAHASDIDGLREMFLKVSTTMVALSREYLPYHRKVFIQFCPMADDFNGANWISLSEEIRNPYFGASMLTCGEVEESF